MLKFALPAALVMLLCLACGAARAEVGGDVAADSARTPTADEAIAADSTQSPAAEARPALAPPGPIGADTRDTLGVHFEIGASSDMSSEQFYQDAFLDSVSLGIKRVDSPESRTAAVWHTSLAGTRSERATSYRLDNELSWGDRVRSDLLSLDWRHANVNEWRWALSPRAEFRHDRTFGRDLEQARASGTAKLAHTLPALESTIELSGLGEWLRTQGSGADFIPDRHGAGLMLRWGREPLAGSEWQLAIGATRRTFPDTSARDHVEERAEASWHRDLEGGHRVDLAGVAGRRSALHPTLTSQDRFSEGELDGALELSFTTAWTASLRGRLETLRYDERDSTGLFDYHLARVEFEPRRASGAWSVRAGPRVEWLSSSAEPSEAYTELGAHLELEWFRTGWWSLSPAYGYRQYRETLAAAPAMGAQPVLASRSSYAFVQVEMMGDQPLALGIKCRLVASGRLEQHSDSAQDARSLYISLDVRRLF